MATSLFISTSTEDKQGRRKGEETQTSQSFSLLAVLVDLVGEELLLANEDTGIIYDFQFSMLSLPLIITYSRVSPVYKWTQHDVHIQDSLQR